MNSKLGSAFSARNKSSISILIDLEHAIYFQALQIAAARNTTIQQILLEAITEKLSPAPLGVPLGAVLPSPLEPVN